MAASRFRSLGQWRRASSGSAATSRCCSSPCCVPREFPRAPVAGSAPISIPVASRITGSANTGMPRGRWALVDAQIDDVQRAKLKLGFDLLDAPRDRFVIAGDAWARCRARDADPATFGIFDMRGLWFIAGNLMRDLAALNNMEMLPWDIWGAMTRPGEPLRDDRLALFDRLSTVTGAPDAAFTELRRFYEGDEDLRVPATVFNAVLNRPEAI